MRELTRDELELALKNAGLLFRRVRSELDEAGVHTFPTGPWYAGMEPFPAA